MIFLNVRGNERSLNPRCFLKKFEFKKVGSKHRQKGLFTVHLKYDFKKKIFLPSESDEDVIFFFQTLFFLIPLGKFEVRCEKIRSKLLAVF